MTIPFPWPVYGTVKNSANDLIVGVTVTATENGNSSDVTDSDGKYLIDLREIGSDGNQVTMSCSYNGEKHTGTFTINVSNPGQKYNIILEEARNKGDIYINTHYNYNDEMYVFNDYKKEGHLKTSEY